MRRHPPAAASVWPSAGRVPYYTALLINTIRHENYAMALYTTIHLHNVPAQREADYARWLDGVPGVEATNVPGYVATLRGERFRPGGIACAGDLSVYQETA